MDEKTVEAWTFGTLQDCKNLREKLDEEGISWEEFLSWVEEKKKQFNEEGDRTPIIMRRCPDCSEALSLSSVNEHPTLMVDGDHKSLWYCTDPVCGYEEYSKETFEEELKKYTVVEG